MSMDYRMLMRRCKLSYDLELYKKLMKWLANVMFAKVASMHENMKTLGFLQPLMVMNKLGLT